MGGIGASQGIQAWTGAFDRSAWQVTSALSQMANAQPNAVKTAAGDGLIDSMVGMQLDAVGVHASVQFIRTQDQMLGTLLDMLA